MRTGFYFDAAAFRRYGNAENHQNRLQTAFPASRLKPAAFGLHVKQKVHHIAVLHDIFLAFYAHFAGFFGFGFAA